MRLFPTLVMLCAFLACAAAYGSDDTQYEQGSLDELLHLPKPETGVDVFTPHKLHFRAVLTEYGQECYTDFLKKVMILVNASREAVEDAAASECITVASERGSAVPLFIDERGAQRLRKEVKLGQEIDIFCEFLYVEPTGPGILVHDFRPVKEH